jgi:fatty-acyl-CoA synthase
MAAAVSQPDVYAGELPVCYVSLHAGAVATNDELQAWAQQYIAERPAWPKHFYVVPSIPVTAVGKIFKPQLRCDATVRLVRRIIQENMGLTQVDVTAQEGGKRGMSVIVTLARSEAHLAPSIQQSLAAYLFESTVVVE